ncbi:hypothetical protein cypCar_00001897 [Cyprinus carpio]|nr:hypothetical protein cypCar_00001897 [Cyprinus carpio]
MKQVHNRSTYNSSQKMYIMMEARLVALFKSHSEYTWTALACKQSGAFSVVVDNYVSDDDSTGVVHQAPYFGADADKNIIKWLKDNGRLVSSSSFKHSYPFCWRSDTPLIYKAVPSWFVRVEHMVEKHLDNNSNCYWFGESVCDLCADQSHMFTARVTCDWANSLIEVRVPEFVREKRFGNWLRVLCVGSTAELEELTGAKVSDLHRESTDHLTIPSRCGKGQLRRVSEVFDCWFESSSMPYGQVHYPFENRREFEDAFITEGIDQTRG